MKVQASFSFARLGTALLCLLCMVALASHSMHDSAWSTSGLGQGAGKNWLGAVGAYLSDALLYMVGRSAWLLILLGFGVAAMQLLNRQVQTLRVFPALTMLVIACVLEWLMGIRKDDLLPAGAGGLLGRYLGSLLLLVPSLAAHQSALILLFVGVGFWLLALTFGVSWWRVTGLLGARLHQRVQMFTQQRANRRDSWQGQEAAKAREIDRLRTMSEPSSHVSSSFAPAPSVLAPSPQIPEALVLAPLTQSIFDPQPQVIPDSSVAPVVPQPVKAAPIKAAPIKANPPKVSKRVIQESQSGLFDDEREQKLPRIDLLDKAQSQGESVSAATLEMTSRLIEKKLSDFGVTVRVVTAMPGPVITRYEIEPATGVKGSQVVNLAKDLARSLSLTSVRVIETIPGKNLMALELPNAKRQTIKLSQVLGSNTYHDARSLLTMGLGFDIVGEPVVADLAKMPHCLVAGTTGSGKSVGINAMILSLLYKASADDVRLLLIDPKMLEMSVYEGIPHLIAPVVTDMTKAAHGLNWCVAEMERRYRLMSKLGVRNLAGFNTKLSEATARGELVPNPFSLNPEVPEPLEKLPHIVVVIDELADLMMVVGKKIEELIARLAQKARAAGIHLVLATQRPSVDVITGLIKANIPTRIAFQVSSKIDSRTILDQMGAESLLGMGDMLYMPSGTGIPTRVHGAFVSDEEVHRVVAFIKSRSEPNYIEGILDGTDAEGALSLDLGGEGGGSSGEKDPLYDQAVEIVLKNRKASISLVQRHLKVGYNRAARMLEDMQTAGLVSALTSSGQREILVNNTSINES